MAAPSTANADSVRSGPGTDRLRVGEKLADGQFLVSPNGRCQLKMDGFVTKGEEDEGPETYANGNLVLYDNGKVIWQSESGSNNECELIVQDIDELFLYETREDGYHMWTSETRRKASGGTAVLSVRDSGVAVLESDGAIIWSTDAKLVNAPAPIYTLAPEKGYKLDLGHYIPVEHPITSENGQYSLSLQTDGSLVLRRNPAKLIVWQRKSESATKATRFAVAYDCRLVVYGEGDQEMWSIGGRLGYLYTTALVLYDDGRLVAQRSLPEHGGDTTIFDNNLSIVARKGDSMPFLKEGEWLPIDQTLMDGDYELGFNKHGNIFIRNFWTEKTTYWYLAFNDTSDAVLLKVANGLIETYDTQAQCVGRREVPRNEDDWEYEPSVLTITNDGHGLLQNRGKTLWASEDDKLRGETPKSKTKTSK